MKKFLSLITAIVLLGTTASSSVFAAGRLQVATKEADIVLDGIRDEGYGAPVEVSLQGAAHTDGLEVTTGTLSAAWKGDTLYFYMEIADTTPNAWSTVDWQNDGPEFFIDLLNTQPESYDDDCVRIRVLSAVTDDNEIWAGQMFSFNGSGATDPLPAVTIDDVAVVVTPSVSEGWTKGYSVEVSYKTPYTMKGGQIIGFDCQIVDDVFGAGARDSQAFLGDAEDVVWSTPSRFGAELVLSASTIASTPSDQTALPEAEQTPAQIQADTAPVTTTVTAPATFDNTTFIVLIAGIAFCVSTLTLLIRKKRDY